MRRPKRHPAASSLAFCALAALLAGHVAEAAAAGPDASARLERRLAEIERLVGDAYFRTALGLVEATREWSRQLPPDPSLAPGLARLELLGATAEVAFGNRDAARAHLRRALALEPDLLLDPRWTSPRLLELVAEIRAETT